MKGLFDARVVCTLGALLLSTTEAHAQDRPKLDLRFRAPAGCPTEAEVTRRTLALIGNTGRGAEVRSQARVERSEDGTFTLTLKIEQGDSRAERALSSGDCAALGEATAWLVALALDPSLSTRAPSRTTEDALKAPAQKTEPAKPVTSEPEPSDEPAQERRPVTAIEQRLRFGLDGGVSAQGLSGPAATLGAHFGLGFGWSYTELRLSHLFERTKEVSAGISARFVSQALALTQCAEFATLVRLAPCVVVRGERTAGDVEGISQELENSSYWLLGGAALQAFYMPVAPLELSASVDVSLPITTRPRFIVDSLEVGEAAFVTVSASIGVGARY